MRLQALREVYEAEGPVATVYLEARPPAEDAEKQVRLRWDALRRQLAEEGASDDALAALDKTVLVQRIGEIQVDGRVVVAGREGVLLNELWDAALGAGDAAHWGERPQLGPYIRGHARSVRLLVAVVDQNSAVVRREVAVAAGQYAAGVEEVVEPDTVESVHKPRGQALSHKHIQRRADEAVEQNAREIAEHLQSVAKDWPPDALVLAGEVQGRAAVHDALPEALTKICHQVESGGTGSERTEEALTAALRELAGDIAAERDRQRRGRFEEAKAQGRTAEGREEVRHAAKAGAVDTIFFGEGEAPSDDGELIAACALTDAEAETLDGSVTDGVAAVLRFELPDDTATG